MAPTGSRPADPLSRARHAAGKPNPPSSKVLELSTRDVAPSGHTVGRRRTRNRGEEVSRGNRLHRPDSPRLANEAIAAAEQESVCLTLGNVIRMSEGLESVPVVSVAPVVDFVTPTYGGRKPMTTIEWTSEQLQPVELAMERMSKQVRLHAPNRGTQLPLPSTDAKEEPICSSPLYRRSPDRRLRGF